MIKLNENRRFGIGKKYALYLTSISFGILLLVVATASIVFSSSGTKLKKDLEISTQKSFENNQKTLMTNVSNYLGHNLYNSVQTLDISVIRNMIRDIKSGLPISDFAVADGTGMILTDGTESDSRMASQLKADLEVVKKNKLMIEPDENGSRVVFPILAGEVVNGYGEVIFSNDALKKTLADQAITIDHTWKQFIMRFVTVAMLGMIIVVGVSLLLSFFFSNTLARPLVKLSQAANLVRSGELPTELKLPGNDEMTDLAAAFNEMAVVLDQKVKERTRLLNEKTKQISDILNAIDEGIFTLNSDFTINEEHSKRAEEFFGVKEFEKENISKVFSLKQTDLSQFQEWFKLIAQPERLRRWKKFVDLVPIKELVKTLADGTKRIIQLDFEPIVEDGKLQKLMVLGKDVTLQRIAEENLARSKNERELQMERTVALVGNEQVSLGMFFEDAERYMTEFRQAKSIENVRSNLSELYRSMHTLKGNAGSFGFKYLTRLAGVAEESLQVFRTTEGTETSDTEHFNRFQKSLEEVGLELREISTVRSTLFASDSDSMMISRSAYETLMKEVQLGHVSDRESTIFGIYELDAQPFEKFAKKFANIVTNFRTRTSKPLEDLSIQNPKGLIHRSVMPTCDTALVHLIRNAVDHGIEESETREASGKGPGKVSLSLAYADHDVCVTLTDDGRGIDPESVCKSAIKKGVITEEEAKNMTSAEKQMLIFRSGFSTREEVTEISGRGVGMDAVKTSIDEAGGRFELESVVGVGTTIKLYLPTRAEDLLKEVPITKAA